MRGFEPGAPAVPIRWFDELDSTNAEVRRLAEAGEGGPLWIAARRQSAGRGRRGRVWETGEGNLAATLLVTTPLEPAEAARMSFVTAVAAGEVIARLSGRAVTLKWPNDVLIDGSKSCGVLIESGTGPAGLWLAVGVGVNLASAPEGAARVGALPPEAVLEALSEAMKAWIRTWLGQGFEPVRQAWLARAHGLGGPCTARIADQPLTGTAEGLDQDGALLLRLADGELRRITAGDVIFGNG